MSPSRRPVPAGPIETAAQFGRHHRGRATIRLTSCTRSNPEPGLRGGRKPMSESDLASEFAALSDVAARLNPKSDTVTQLIEQFQDKLRALNVGLEAWVLLKSEPGSVVVPGQRLTAPAQVTP